MNICVIGGGNMGTLISAEISLSKKHNVRLLASKAHLFSNEIIIDDWNDNTQKRAHIGLITADKQKALENAELILITVPANALAKLVEEIYPYVQKNAIIGMIPGSGGAEFVLSKFRQKGCIIFGLQRVPSISRVKEYGRTVSNQGRKAKLEISCMPQESTNDVADLVAELFNIPCDVASNYLNITFTPSNQILHTTRIYTLFKHYENGIEYPQQKYFYKDWDDDSSVALIACDYELQMICKELSFFDLSGVKSLLEHYEVNDYQEMTYKLSHIRAFANIKIPMILLENGNYVPDKENRYFTSDIPYGLCIIRGFADILNVPTPNIDKVLKWYEKFADLEYFVNEKFIGKDLINTGIPQNYGINTEKDIIDFYS